MRQAMVEAKQAGKLRGQSTHLPQLGRGNRLRQKTHCETARQTRSHQGCDRKTPLCQGKRMLPRHTTYFPPTCWCSAPHNMSFLFFLLCFTSAPRLQAPHTSAHTNACFPEIFCCDTNIQVLPPVLFRHETPLMILLRSARPTVRCLLMTNKSSGYMCQF